MGKTNNLPGVVTCIKIRKENMECVSASDDGTCIIWDLNRFVRNQIIFSNTLFKAVCYDPFESQLLTGGSDRKVCNKPIMVALAVMLAHIDCPYLNKYI